MLSLFCNTILFFLSGFRCINFGLRKLVSSFLQWIHFQMTSQWCTKHDLTSGYLSCNATLQILFSSLHILDTHPLFGLEDCSNTLCWGFRLTLSKRQYYIIRTSIEIWSGFFFSAVYLQSIHLNNQYQHYYWSL